MSDAELSISELRRKRAGSTGRSPIVVAPDSILQTLAAETASVGSIGSVTPRPAGANPRQTPRPAPIARESIDSSRFLAAIRRRWHWLALGLLAGGAIGAGFGFARANYSLPLTLTLRDLSTRFEGSEGVSYKPPRPSSQAMINFLTSDELLNAVAAQANPPLPARQLRRQMDVNPEKGSENIEVEITGANPGALVNLANLYTGLALARSKDAQREDPASVCVNLTSQIAGIEKRRDELNLRLKSLRANSGIADPALENPAFEKEWVELRVKIDLARGELAALQNKTAAPRNEQLQQRLQDANSQLLACFSEGKLDEHPDVKRLRSEIAEIKKQLDGEGVGESGAARAMAADRERKALEGQIHELEIQADAVKARLDKLYENAGEYAQIKSELDRLDLYRKTLNDRRFEARQYFDSAEGYFRPPSAPTSLADIDTGARNRQAAGVAGRGGFAGLALALGLVLLLEYADPRLKTATDVERVTGLRVLASLGDLNKIDSGARRAWAFRTWTILSGVLAESAQQGVVCGFISCGHGEGRSTWVSLLVDAAKERGFEVVKLAFNAPAPNAAAESQAGAEVPKPESAALVSRESRAEVARTNGASVIHVELPSFVWDLDRRVQFQKQLAQWRASRTVILVDLPPASMPEAVLLAENLPQLIWLSDAGKSPARQTRLHLETLRHTRCKLVGAVFNHEPEPLIKL